MNASRIFFCVIFVVFLSPTILVAQTVESVLRGLQERVMMLDLRKKYSDPHETDWELTQAKPFIWPANLRSFPQDGDITGFSDAIQALNAASRLFDDIKSEFVCYDTKHHQFVNLIHEGASGAPSWDQVDGDARWVGSSGSGDPTSFNIASINLPSVGRFTEANWREKLQLLASNVNQLKALIWPVYCRLYETAAFEYWDSQTPVSVQCQQDTRDWNVLFPTFIANEYAQPNALYARTIDHSFGKVIPELALKWTVGGHSQRADEGSDAFFGRYFGGTFSLESAVGARVFSRNLSQVSNEENTPSISGEFHFFVGGAVFPFGDLTEKIAESLSNDSAHPFRIGNLIKINKNPTGAADGFSLGEYGPTHDPDGEFVKSLPVATAASNALTFLDLQPLTITGNLVASSNRIKDYFKAISDYNDNSFLTPFEFNLYCGDVPVGVKSRRHYYQCPVLNGKEYPYGSTYHFQLALKSVYIPNFTKISTTPVVDSAFEHLPGEVEAGVISGDFVRVHIGRGLTDSNQTAWLGSREDGFGWVTFNGSPDAFELLYAPTVADYGHTPFGGATFDTVSEFSDTEKIQSGWSDRFSYYACWTSPQLRQIKGTDVLVNITYPNPYTKNIAFYWRAEVGEKGANGLYSLGNLVPFKTIEITNPTISGVGARLPTDTSRLRIRDGERYYEVSRRNEATQTVYKVQLGTQVGGSDYQKITTIRYDESGSTRWIIQELAGATTTAWTYCDFAPWRNSFWSEWPEPKTITTWNDDGEHVTTFSWSGESDVKHLTLEEISWSGPETWSANGRVLRMDAGGLVGYEAFSISGKLHETIHNWSANKRDTFRRLGGQTYYLEAATYSDNFNQVDISVGGEHQANTIYSNIAGTSIETIYSSGFRERTSRSPGIVTSQSGWGSQYASGTVRSMTYARNGSPVSMSLIVNGITVESTTGSDFTGFGAPKKITGLNGALSEQSYYETGVRWGVPTETKAPTGVTSSSGIDAFFRTTWMDDGFQAFSYSYPQPQQISVVPASTDGPTRTTNVLLNASGGLKSLVQKEGTWSTLNIVPGGTSSIERFGKQKNFSVDRSGVLNSMGNGMGSRGSAFDFSVLNGRLYTDTIAKKKNGSDAYTIRTFYDTKGRIRSISRPGEDGTPVTESWYYDDSNRSVTYTPVAGPAAQNLVSTLSSDGATLTISKGGSNFLRYNQSAQNGLLIRTTSIFDDSTGGVAGWKEVERETFNPLTGERTTVPWGLTQNAISSSPSVPDITGTDSIVNGATGDLLDINLTEGLPVSISGTANGVSVDIHTFDWSGNRLTKVGGTIAGMPVELSIGIDGRITNLKGPGSDKNFNYGDGQGFSLTETDSVQETSLTRTADSVGDPTWVAGSGTLTLSLETGDIGTGQETVLKIGGAKSVTMSFNHLGSLTGKNYSDELAESYPRNADGSIQQLSAGSITATVEETPNSRTVSYPDLTIAEQFYNVGARSSVTAPADARSFIYECLALRKETHTDGVWSGWSVDYLPDTKGRLQGWRISGGGTNREFGFAYDAHSRLERSTSPNLTATYGPRHSTGKLGTLTRSGLVSRWSYDDIGRLSGLANTIGNKNFAYTYTNRDARHRIKSRIATIGSSWTGLDYDDADQLKIGKGGEQSLNYGYDPSGNRNGQQDVASHQVNALNQIYGRTLLSRGFGVYGTVALGAKIRVTSTTDRLGTELSVHPQTGEYFGWWNLPQNAEQVVDVQVRGTLTGAGEQGRDAVADQELRLVVAPVDESIFFDSAGRTKEDAFWIYTWDGPGRLKRMDRKPGMIRERGALSEVVEFEYDADGRRTQKIRTLTYPKHTRVEKSRVLWAGWLPVLEERSRDGQVTDKRWFQWGADVSGTLDEAGGIGGLVAIIEEKPSGQSRTLLPIQDGLGNVTAVIDSANGNTVARYDYGPFGEPMGEYGETDVCPFRWQTKWYDRESEHYYFGYRHYDPRIGRWLSRDPLGESGGVNLYAYCGNDPVNKHDPVGMQGVSFNLPNPLALVSRLGQFVTGWIDEGAQLDEREQANRDFAIRNPGIARDSSSIGRAHRVVQMQQEFFQNKVLEADGLLHDGTSDAVLFGRKEELWWAKAYNDSVLEVGLRKQDRFEQGVGVAMTFTPFVAGRAGHIAKGGFGAIRGLARRLDWSPVLAPYRGSFQYTNMFPGNVFRMPGLPKLKPSDPIREMYSALGIETSSTATNPSRTYTVYRADGELFKFGVTDADLVRLGQSLKMAGPGSYASHTGIVPKYVAHLQEKYLRSLHYASTSQWRLPGMRVPYPIDFLTKMPITEPSP